MRLQLQKMEKSDMGSESEEKKEMLIIDGNAIYELDLECVRKKQGKQEGNGRCVEQSEERRQSANHTGD